MRLEASWRKTFILSKRELLSRIKSKGFWLGTLVLPVFMGILFVVPGLILTQTTSRLDLVLVDATGAVGEGVARRLEERGDDPRRRIADFDLTLVEPAQDREAQRRELDQRLLDEEIDAWLWIDRRGLEEGEVEYRARNVSNTLTQEVLARELSSVVRKVRLAEAGYDPEAVQGLLESVDLTTVRVSAEGSREEAGEAGFILAYVLFFLLYIVLLVWGQQVLQGVLEEKSSRVVEVIVSSARPFELMLGKLVGIGAAALIQFGIWMACIVALTAPGLVGALASLPDDFQVPTVSLAQAFFVVLFFVLGFFVYSSMFAAVGSAFNNPQEAQQLSMVPTMAIVAPLFFLLPVINDTGGALAVVVSLIPFLSPILMPLRVAVEMPPAWQLGLSVLLTVAFIVFMVWLCGRIYRTGILMYGKKPTLKELWRWARHA